MEFMFAGTVEMRLGQASQSLCRYLSRSLLSSLLSLSVCVLVSAPWGCSGLAFLFKLRDISSPREEKADKRGGGRGETSRKSVLYLEKRLNIKQYLVRTQIPFSTTIELLGG
jgi:hypothetical protein